VAAGVSTSDAAALRVVELSTPLGELTVVLSSSGVVMTAFDDQDPAPAIAAMAERLGATARYVTRGSATIRRETRSYFEGRGRAFSTPPDLRSMGEGFPRRVLEVTATIPYGELWTYGDVAAMAGNPGAARAAGTALARCPMELWVPCHRVVRAGGTIGGYGRHEERKRWLLRHEGVLG
jgi:methylated-DNA-[protein]-cysteine S-methyltransferase